MSQFRTLMTASLPQTQWQKQVKLNWRIPYFGLVSGTWMGPNTERPRDSANSSGDSGRGLLPGPARRPPQRGQLCIVGASPSPAPSGPFLPLESSLLFLGFNPLFVRLRLVHLTQESVS